MINTIHFNIEGSLETRSRIVARLLKHAGVEAVELQGDELNLDYDLSITDPRTLMESIETAGLSVVLNWVERFLLSLRCYRESVIRDNANNEIGWDSCVREIYVSRYRHRRHGRRDDRPKHWRQDPGSVDKTIA